MVRAQGGDKTRLVMVSMMRRKPLYPPIQPYDSSYLDTGDGHQLYYEQVGRPDGVAAVFLHGGPGGGGDVNARRFFDPDRYRLVIVDQRGAGRSRPHASLENNTTWHLVADLEALRAHLGIEAWLVFGGSWGSTLALAYAERHPTRVSALILRGIFLLRRKELRWFYQFGASEIFPERWSDYVGHIPPAERGDLLAAYHRRLTDPDEAVRLEAARHWSGWEGATSSLLPDLEREETFTADEFALALARIEAHYFINAGFFDSENQLIDAVVAITRIPAVIVQGRYDVVCPATTAWELSRAWPEARYCLVPDAGHSAFEPGIAHELVSATDRYLSQGTP
jgi:proline iminopeptidase